MQYGSFQRSLNGGSPLTSVGTVEGPQYLALPRGSLNAARARRHRWWSMFANTLEGDCQRLAYSPHWRSSESPSRWMWPGGFVVS